MGAGIAPKPVTPGTPFGISNPRITAGAKPVSTVGGPMPGTAGGGPTGLMTSADGSGGAGSSGYTAPGLPAASGYITTPANQGGPTLNTDGYGGAGMDLQDELARQRRTAVAPFIGRLY